MSELIFEPFMKLKRLSAKMVITEKLDGTNAQIAVGEDGEFLVGSRKREITLGDDNFGFAAWAYERKDELVSFLGPGRHFGEWYGQGIQRKYGLEDKRFALFNTTRWGPGRQELPDYLHVVPVLFEGMFNTSTIDDTMADLLFNGSIASPGFDNPEGVVIFHVASNKCFKKTYDHDGTGKGGLRDEHGNVL